MRPLGPDDPHEIAGYVLRARLGEGGMGTVYLSHTRGGRPVAFKVVRREYGEDPEFRRRFRREVQAALRVQGPYTAAVLDSNTEGVPPWLASEYVSGPSLATAVAEHGPLPPAAVWQLIAGVAEALKVIHAAGVIHRDLKPSNVLLAEEGPRVIDFGIARATDATALTGTDVRLGTPAFMAPEQVTGRGVSPALDVFALGLIAFFAATRLHAFGEGPAHALLYRVVGEEPDLSACPEELRELISGCLAKEPTHRPSPEQVIEDCRTRAGHTSLSRGPGGWLPPVFARDIVRAEETLRGVAAAPPPPPPAPREPTVRDGPAEAPGPSGPRRRGLRVAALLLAALVVGGGSAFLVNRLDDRGDGGGADTGGPRTEPGWTLKAKDKALVIRAPRYNPDAEYGSALGGGKQCFDGTATSVDLSDLTVSTSVDDNEDNSFPGTLKYLDCPKSPDNGLKILDGEGVMGATEDSAPTPSECREAARRSRLPNPVPLEQIRKDTVLREGVGLCVETEEKAVVHLWITQVNEEPDNDDLRTYVTTGTQWVPRKS